jgi:hypothetical protein
MMRWHLSPVNRRPKSSPSGRRTWRPSVTELEARYAPSNMVVIFGPDNGRSPVTVLAPVRVFDAVTHQEKYNFFPFGTSFMGGVRVTAGDVTGDGIPDVIVGSGPGMPAEVRIYDGASPGPEPRLIRTFMPYGPFNGGVFVAAGDINGDGHADIVVAPDQGTGPEFFPPPEIAYDGADFSVLASGHLYGPFFEGGVRVALADVNGDGHADLVAGPGPGMEPLVKIISGATGHLLHSYDAFPANFTNGIYVAGGDVDGDGMADTVVGAGQGGGSLVRVFDSSADGHMPPPLREIVAYPGFNGSVRVAVQDINRDGQPDILTVPGPGTGPLAKAFDFQTGMEIGQTVLYNGPFIAGVFIGAGPVLPPAPLIPNTPLTASSLFGGSGLGFQADEPQATAPVSPVLFGRAGVDASEGNQSDAAVLAAPTVEQTTALDRLWAERGQQGLDSLLAFDPLAP